MPVTGRPLISIVAAMRIADRRPRPGHLQDVEEADDAVLEPVDDRGSSRRSSRRTATPMSGMAFATISATTAPTDEPDAIPGEQPLHAPMLAARTVPPMHASPGVRPALATLTVFSSAPRTIPSSNGAPPPRARPEQVVGVGDSGLPADTIRSPASMPAAGRALPSSTPRTSTPSRSGRPTERRSRRATWFGAIATPSADARRGLAATERIDPGLERGISRKREVEALTDPVGVEPDQPSRPVDERSTGRAGGKRRGVLDAARDPPAAWAAERARDRRHEAERHAHAAAVGRRDAEDRVAERRRVAVAPAIGRGAGGIDRTTARSPSPSTPVTVPIVERPSLNVTVTSLAAQVVGVGQDLAVGDRRRRTRGCRARSRRPRSRPRSATAATAVPSSSMALIRAPPSPCRSVSWQ